jgi:uracil-DNA glycosylase family 4
MTDSLAALQILRAKIEAADPTPDLRATATQLVFGTGNPDADIVFIGEAPGKNEDASGEPFVGAAGKFLNELLASVELERKDIYITNIVKYRPPNNRDPLPQEKSAFLPYLFEQIGIINPSMIVTLGRHSMECLLPGLKISQVHGNPKRIKMQAHRDGSVVVLPLFHPAAALYNGGLRQTLMDDFAQLPAILQKIHQQSEQ